MDLQHLFGAPHPQFRSRRDFLKRGGNGFGLLALSALLDGLLVRPAGAAPSIPSLTTPPTNPLLPRVSHFPARAKSVIWLFMNGGPSQVDTFDYKPELEKRDGQDLAGFDKQTGFFANAVGGLMKSPFKFSRHGRSGSWVSELFPAMAQHVDKMAFVHSCFTESNNHSPALFAVNSGIARMGFPSVGAWVTYGLGSVSQNLPAFVVMYDTLGRGLPKGNALNWGAGFLPGVYQGTALKAQGAPIEDLSRATGMGPAEQRRQLDLIARLNGRRAAAPDRHDPFDAELSARVESFELAYRMQMAAPEALDIDAEPEHIKRLYGLDRPKATHFARQCLTARRLVERGVRFVQIYSGGMENQLSWDGHIDIAGNHGGFAQETDVPVAGLLADLAQRGLLDDTLVIWGGEFGRLPLAQKGDKPGRDHNPHAFTVWMAGGGAKGGVHHGATDEIGHRAVQDRVSINDLHATILHLLGLDHEKLTYRYQGRDFRLTDVAGNVVNEIIA
jgi:hypothetical protein